jgi:hypothetical protein
MKIALQFDCSFSVDFRWLIAVFGAVVEARRVSKGEFRWGIHSTAPLLTRRVFIFCSSLIKKPASRNRPAAGFVFRMPHVNSLTVR